MCDNKYEYHKMGLIFCLIWKTRIGLSPTTDNLLYCTNTDITIKSDFYDQLYNASIDFDVFIRHSMQ